MSERNLGPTPSKIVGAAADQPARKRAAPQGERTRSWLGIVSCTFPVLGFVVAFLLGGVMGGGNTESRFYLLGILTLLFILGVGAGLGVGVFFDSRKKRLAPALAVGFNGTAFLLVLLASLFPAEPEAPPEFQNLEATDSVALTTVRPGIGG